MKTTCLIVGLALVGTASAKTLNVVTTLPDLASIVQSVGRDRVRVSSIITGARNPHFLEAKPSYMSRAASADLWVAVGLDLEVGYEPLILEGSRNARIQPGKLGCVHVGDWVAVRDKPVGAVGRAQGDVHPQGNPHVWLDPYNGRVIAAKLAERMGDLEPANRAFFKANADAFVRDLDEAMFGAPLVGKYGGAKLWQWDSEDLLIENLRKDGDDGRLSGWSGAMRKFWKSPIVIYHRSWNYLAYRFGLKIVAELEPKPGLDPTPGHVASVIRIAEAQKARAILQESFYSTRNAEFVAARTGAKVVVCPGSVGHDAKIRGYIHLFDTIVAKLAAALG
jgi:zinc/manganese transport system substrate-binding protein